MIRTSQTVSTVSACSDACVGNQSISSQSVTPSTDAIAPIASSCLKWLRLSSVAVISSLPIQRSTPMDAATYRTAGTEGTDRPAVWSACVQARS